VPSAPARVPGSSPAVARTALAPTRQIVAFDEEMLTSITPLLMFAAAAADSRAACGPSPTSRAPPITGSAGIRLGGPRRQEAKFKVNNKNAVTHRHATAARMLTADLIGCWSVILMAMTGTDLGGRCIPCSASLQTPKFGGPIKSAYPWSVL
jgi:hypothetical protein